MNSNSVKLSSDVEIRLYCDYTKFVVTNHLFNFVKSLIFHFFNFYLTCNQLELKIIKSVIRQE